MLKMTRRVSIKASLAVAGLVAIGIGSAAHAETGAKERLASGKVTIGIHNRAPWGFRSSTGEVSGYHPDLVKAALEPLGIKEINFVITEFGALIPGLNANRFDMIASGIAITPKRCQEVIFSEPDLAVGDGIIVKQGNPQNIHSYADFAKNSKLRLAGGRGTENTKNAIAAGVPENQILQLHETTDLVSAVIGGRADAATLSAPSVVSFLQDKNVRGLERATPFTGSLKEDGRPAAMYTAIAFRSDDTVLRDLFNERLAKLKADGMVRKIMETYGFTDAEMAPDIKTADVCKGS